MFHNLEDICDSNWILKGRELLTEEGPKLAQYKANAAECGVQVGDRGNARIFFASQYYALQYPCCDWDSENERVIELMVMLEVVPMGACTMF